MKRAGARLCVVLASLALALLVSEGVLSFAFGTSWRALLRGSSAEPFTATDAERFHAAALTPGPYRTTEDPFVGYALKASTEVDTLEGRPGGLLRTDDLGQRLRTGPEPAEGALRVVVLGDSIAFGYGLRDAEVLAAVLEDDLRAVLGPGRSVACFTVATPSWNYRNALRFLLDHLERLDPDLVLYVPVKNDVEDSYGVTEAGQRREANDPVVPGARLYFRPEMALIQQAWRTHAASPPDPALGGPEVHYAGLTASSRWRLEDLAGMLVRTEERLARRGARLVLVPHEQTDYHRLLRCALLDRAHTLPVMPLFEALEPPDTLGWDPHPSAKTVALMARFLCDALLERGWVSGANAGALPPLTEGELARRAHELEDAELPAWRDAYRARTLAALRARIAPADIEGLQQIYGGLNVDGSMGTDLAAVLPAGRTLRIHLRAIEEDAALHPLELSVRVDGRELGPIVMERGGEIDQRFALEPAQAAAPFEVWIAAQDWVSVKVRGRSWIQSARVVELESLP